MQKKSFESYFTEDKLKYAFQKIYLLPKKDQDVLYLKFGKNLDENNSLDSTVYAHVGPAIKKLQRMVDDPNYIPRKIGTRRHRRNGQVKVLSVEPTSEERYRIMLPSFNKERGNSEEEYPEILTSCENDTVDSIFTEPIFKEAIELVPDEFKIVTAFHLGIYGDKAYSISALAEIFNISEDLVREKVNMGISFFREIIKAYENTFDRDFPVQRLTRTKEDTTIEEGNNK